ncbi:MAG: hypothetical protein L0312_24785, partial [Acidobacteria bacterium]|nr:hypothetical protein [Acidobacteriota bacterium]
GALTAGPDNADGFASAQPQYVVPEHIVLAEFVAFTLAVVKNANDGNMRLEILNRAGQLRSVSCTLPSKGTGANGSQNQPCQVREDKVPLEEGEL